MAFEAQLDGILAHARAAGAALTEPMTDITVGWPVPRGRGGRLYWAGESETQHMGGQRTLTSRLIAPRLRLTFYWPISDAGETAARSYVLEMHDLIADLRTRVLDDSQLGGLSTDMEMTLAEPDLLQAAGGGFYAIADVDFILDYDEYTIAP